MISEQFFSLCLWTSFVHFSSLFKRLIYSNSLFFGVVFDTLSSNKRRHGPYHDDIHSEIEERGGRRRGGGQALLSLVEQQTLLSLVEAVALKVCLGLEVVLGHLRFVEAVSLHTHCLKKII